MRLVKQLPSSLLELIPEFALAGLMKNNDFVTNLALNRNTPVSILEEAIARTSFKDKEFLRAVAVTPNTPDFVLKKLTIIPKKWVPGELILGVLLGCIFQHPNSSFETK